MKELKNVKSRYDFSLDNRQVVLIVSGLILVLMLSFLMGTLFGKNLSRMSDQGAMAMASSPAPAADTAPAQTEPAAENSSAKPAVADLSGDTDSRAEYIRNLESMKVPSTGEPGAQAAQIEEPSAPPVMAKLTPPSAGTPEAAPTASVKTEPAKPAADKPEAAKETVSKPVVPAGSFTIQLASLPERDDAVALVKDLQSKRFEAYMLTVTLPGKGTFYRVRVGHYPDLNMAKKALGILQNREGKYFDAWITQ